MDTERFDRDRSETDGLPVRVHQLAIRSFLLALVFCGLGKVLGSWLYQLPVFALLAYTSVVFVVSSMLFGWMGLLAAAATQIAFILQRDGEVSWPSLVSYSLAGGMAWCVFRYVPGLTRSLSTKRSLAWFVGVTAVGALVSTLVISGTSGSVSDLFESVMLWSRSTIVTLWVEAPLLLILSYLVGHRWLVPIPGEVQLRMPRRVSLAIPDPGAGQRLEIASIESRPVDLNATLWRCVALISTITVAKLWFAVGWGPSLLWWSLPYLLPIYWCARELWLPGGLIGAGLSGFATLLSDSLLAPETGISAEQTLAVYAQLLFFWFVGIFLGWGAEREGRLVERLASSHSHLRRGLDRVVQALTGALEAKDEYTEGHLQRVTSYAVEVGRRLGLEERELELLGVAAKLHDMGKIAIPEAILNKPGPLSANELRIMRRHPEIGARILEGVEGLQDVAPLVRHHHERWDGNTEEPFPGYPGGLSGEQIPIGAQIITVVDTFDALTTTRPYRKARSIDHARQVLLDERGRQFAPDVVDMFLELLDERPWLAT